MSEGEVEDEIVAQLSDYLDGTLSADARAAVDAKLAGDAEWKRVHDDLVEQRKMISALRKAKAPETFTRDVTDTIHKRSRGAFFGGGSRVPFGAVIVVALGALVAIWLLMRGTDTGSHKRVDDGSAERIVP